MSSRLIHHSTLRSESSGHAHGMIGVGSAAKGMRPCRGATSADAHTGGAYGRRGSTMTTETWRKKSRRCQRVPKSLRAVNSTSHFTAFTGGQEFPFFFPQDKRRTSDSDHGRTCRGRSSARPLRLTAPDPPLPAAGSPCCRPTCQALPTPEPSPLNKSPPTRTTLCVWHTPRPSAPRERQHGMRQPPN